MSTQELVTIDIQPPIVDINYEVAKQQLGKWLKQYKGVVITEDQVSEGRKLATEINQSRLAMNKTLKEKIAESAAPITDAKEKVKHLDGMHEETRQLILKQVAAHDQNKLDIARKLLTDLRRNLWEQYGVEPEFHSAEFDDLIKISNVTEKENLTKAAKDGLEDQVRDDKALQDKIRMRLLELENRSYKAGLRAPLSRDHVANFLWGPDDVYERELQRILDVEVGRQTESDQKYREQEERKAREAEAAAAQEKERQERLSQPETAPETPAEPDARQRLSEATEEPTEAPETAAEDDGKQDAIAVATFKVRVHPRVSDEKIKEELKRRMAEAKIDSLHNISIQR